MPMRKKTRESKMAPLTAELTREEIYVLEAMYALRRAGPFDSQVVAEFLAEDKRDSVEHIVGKLIALEYVAPYAANRYEITVAGVDFIVEQRRGYGLSEIPGFRGPV